MDNKLLEFGDKLKEKEVNDAYNQESIDGEIDAYMYGNGKQSINFWLCYDTYGGGIMWSGKNIMKKLIELDSVDLEYFKKKYLPKLVDEYSANLAELNNKYNK